MKQGTPKPQDADVEHNAWAKASQRKEHERKTDMSEIAIEVAASE